MWNLFIQDQTSMAPNIKKRATKQCGQYDGNPVLAVIVALDDFLFKTGLHEGFLDECLGLIADTPGYFEGIARPRPS